MLLRKLQILIMIGTLMAASCRKEDDNSAQDSSKSEATSETTQGEFDSCNDEANLVTYYKDIKPILDEFCVSCHNSAAGETRSKPPTSFADYTSARAWGYLMPGFRLFETLSAEDQQAIQNWIDGGLTEPDYNNSAKEILDANCVSCHDADAPSRKGLPSTNFEDPEIVRMMGSQIPMFGPLKNVSEEQQRLLDQWVKDGLSLGDPL